MSKIKAEKIDQNGAILITLIVAMVIMAMTASGMLYFSTTSSYGELLANRQERAYYIGESGANYALQKFIANPVTNGHFPVSVTDRTYKLGNDQFTVLTYDKPSDPTRLIIESTGIVGSGWLTTRQLVTRNIVKATATPPGIPSVTTDATGTVIGFNEANPTAEVLDPAWTTAVGETTVTTDGTLEFKGTENAINMNPTNVNLDAAWVSNGNLSSYFLQVKIDNSKMSPGDYYLIGLSFRVLAADLKNCYGLSFYRSNGANGPNTWYDTPAFANFRSTIPQLKDDKVYAVLWKKVDGTFSVLAYTEMVADYGVTASGKLISWSTLLIKVNEKFDTDGVTRRNYIKAYVQSPSHTVSANYPLYPLGTISWNVSSFKPITWTKTCTSTCTTSSITEVTDAQFTTGTFGTSRPEIGVHAFYDSSAKSAQLFNDFSSAIQGMTGGGSQY